MSPAAPVCLITGASAGIGAALAWPFARAGHALALTARRQDRLNQLADAIAGEGHRRPAAIAADLTSPAGIAALAKALAALGLEPAFVVNNAGFGRYGAAAEIDRARQLAMIDLNMRALTDLSLRWIDSIKRHRGGILNVASVAGFLPGPGMAVYYATKAYVLSFSEALHAELGPEGVRVTALCPGPVETEFFGLAETPEDYFPAAFMRTAERVAREGYEGLMAGRRVVVPGAANRIVPWLPRLLPRALTLAIMAKRWRKTTRNGE
jgi:short-subunit dehydrogenase